MSDGSERVREHSGEVRAVREEITKHSFHQLI